MSKTALELTPKEWQAYQPLKIQAPSEEMDTLVINRKKQAWHLAQQANQLLCEKFKAQRVVLFGSLATDTEFTIWSDVDLVAWGIPPEHFYAAVAAVTGLSPDIKIDLIDPDTCRPSLRAIIERDGVVL